MIPSFVVHGVLLKVLGIVCSPRSGGNTEILVYKALKSAEREGAEVEMWSFAGKNVKPCDHCESCFETGECRIKDDMQDLYSKMIEADGIIFGSPVYFWSVSAQAKLVMDRTFALQYPTNRLHGKLGGAIAVAETRAQAKALTVINIFFLCQGIIPVGLGVSGTGSKKGEVEEDERSLTRATELGRRMVKLIRQSIRSNKET
jgi:multimeric flavodoxin WrbA